LLQSIAEWGNGRYYYTDNPSSIPQIFAKETMTASKSALHEAPFVAQQVRPAEFLEGIDLSASPFLLGYVMTKIKPTAQMWLATERGDPLMVSWRYGLGQSAAFTSDARNRWAVEWLKWEGFSRFWAQTVRQMSRVESVKNFPIEVTRQDGGFNISVDVPDVRGGYADNLSGEIISTNARGQTVKGPLEEVESGRLEGFIPAREMGHYHTQLMIRQNEEMLNSMYVAATLGYPQEFSLQEPDEILLNDLATVTGGTYGVTIDQLLEKDGRKAVLMQELWPWLVGLALLLFIADVANRRLPEKK